MKQLLLLVLFIIGLMFAPFNYKGLANQGNFDSLVLDFRQDIPSQVMTETIQELGEKYHQTIELNSIFAITDRVYILRGDRQVLDEIRKSPIIENTEYVEPNYVYQLFKAPNDPDYSKQWNFRSINVEPAWNETQGEGITVAVIDTGVSRVPDLSKTEFVKGYDFVNHRSEADDDNGHGTHVAGTIAQSTNNNYGVAGIAYKAKIMPLKVLSKEGGGTVANIADAIRYAADNGADVINMSLGGGGESILMQKAIDYAYDKGVVIIAAAGNSNQNASSYPARYPKVISVSAVDAAGEKAPYSNYGAGVDLSAPGGGENGKILQETIDPNTGQAVFAEFQGTSMASPHVAAVAALVKAIGVSEPSEVLNILKESSRKVAEDPLNYYGAGQLDADQAVQVALKGKITFNDFFRWLRDNGYLNPKFWIDGGAVALLPKILMVLGSYLLAWLLRNYFPFRWNWSFSNGLILGSSGLFILQGFYIFDLPQWPFRLMGSSIPELGSSVFGSTALNPLFASVLIPFLLIILLAGHPDLKWFAIGTSLGVASCLIISAIMSPEVWGFSSELLARSFLITNAVLCLGLARLMIKGEAELV
jgi:serine protease